MADQETAAPAVPTETPAEDPLVAGMARVVGEGRQEFGAERFDQLINGAFADGTLSSEDGYLASLAALPDPKKAALAVYALAKSKEVGAYLDAPADVAARLLRDNLEDLAEKAAYSDEARMATWTAARRKQLERQFNPLARKDEGPPSSKDDMPTWLRKREAQLARAGRK